MWVKICANTNVEDALAACEAGADAVGFVFAPSKRQVNAELVREISAGLPTGVERVGVFGPASAAEIAASASFARLDAVQLHTRFDNPLTQRLSELLGPQVSIIQTVHWPAVWDDGLIREAAQDVDQIAGFAPGRRVLLDTRTGGASGGTGVTFDWKAAAGVLSFHSELLTIAAGGLRPSNVAEAIRVLRPWGVDVASGVESEPGTKDWGKVREFIRNAREA